MEPERSWMDMDDPGQRERLRRKANAPRLLIVALREDPDLATRARSGGWWLDTLAQVEKGAAA